MNPGPFYLSFLQMMTPHFPLHHQERGRGETGAIRFSQNERRRENRMKGLFQTGSQRHSFLKLNEH